MAQRENTPKGEKEEQKAIHAGHRERVRERFRTGGLQSFSEHEVLELLLMYAIYAMVGNEYVLYSPAGRQSSGA